MRSNRVVAILALAAFAAPTALAATVIVNPHSGEHCLSCHLKLPEKGQAGATDYHFLAEDIDPTCLICHQDACCTIGQKHQTHTSGIDRWDKRLYGTPDKLPLSDGYITCATCHFWRRELNPAPRDYKLVRLVDIGDSKIDWTSLCADCHKDY